jgi:hypothetical protein
MPGKNRSGTKAAAILPQASGKCNATGVSGTAAARGACNG